MDKVKNILKNKYVMISVFVIAILSLIVALVLIFIKEEDRFTLNPIYDVYPEEVRELYSNVVEVSCSGDLYFDIDVDSGEVSIEDMDEKYMIDYAFSHLDKKYGLNKSLKQNVIEKTIDKLFAKELDLSKYINNYRYGGYIYNIKDGELVGEKSECENKVKYVSRLYGYSYGTEVLSMDVNIGYVKDGILYNVQDKKLGKYVQNNIEELDKLFIGVPYYRYNYIKDGDVYKLKSVQLNIRY